MTGKPLLIKLHWILSSQFGLDPRGFLRSLRGVPRFLRDWRRFRPGYAGTMTLKPCLHDWYEEGGVTRNEYFWQDLLVARWIFETKPQKHVDVGSRVDGFVAHVASFREIEVFDVRPISTQVPGVLFKQADLMQPIESVGGEYCDSLSCLHAIEHFGLGRYGDTIDPWGYQHGMANLARLLKVGGRLYLSTPIGRERVEFNANRVFDPRTIIQCAEECGLCLHELTAIGEEGTIDSVRVSERSLSQLALARYCLGLFVFIRQQK
jgi:hypothetical protein